MRPARALPVALLELLGATVPLRPSTRGHLGVGRVPAGRVTLEAGVAAAKVVRRALGDEARPVGLELALAVARLGATEAGGVDDGGVFGLGNVAPKALRAEGKVGLAALAGPVTGAHALATLAGVTLGEGGVLGLVDLALKRGEERR